jgi:hypothetical protein
MTRSRDLILQGTIFLALSTFGLLLLREAVRVRLVRLILAFVLCVVCLLAEAFVLVRGTQLVWKVSGKLSARLSGIVRKNVEPSTLLTGSKN